KSWTAHSVRATFPFQSDPGLTMPSILRIVVVDSDAESRTSLRKILGGMPGAVVVGEFGEVRQALLETPGRRPDLVLLEVPAGREAGTRGALVRELWAACHERA